MIRIRFIAPPEGGRKGMWKVGETRDFTGRVEEGYARKYIDRGWAEDVTPMVAKATAQELVATTKADDAKDEADRVAAEAAKLKARGEVEIPENWAELAAPELRALADQLTDEPTKNKGEATAAVEAEIKRRSELVPA